MLGKKKLKEVRQWLTNMRIHSTKNGFSSQNFFVINPHALSCKCRIFTEKNLIRLLCAPDHKPHVKTDASKPSEPDRFEVWVDDLTPELDPSRKKCKLILRFEVPTGLFEIISAWRANSPNPKYDNCPRCLYDPVAKTCPMEAERVQKTRPRSRI